MRFIHVTDTHIVPHRDGLHGLDPVARLEACVADINRQREGVDFCVFTGDLCDRGDEAAYRVLRATLDQLRLPYYLLLGNHDRREPFARVFPEVSRDDKGFVQSAIERQEGVFLFLDTVDEGKHSGAYCRARRRWLRAQLKAAGERPVYLFMHHPPFDVGLPSLDRMRLADADAFAKTLRTSPNLAHIFFGHVHRPISGKWKGVSFSALPGTNHQIATDFEAVSPMPYSHGPPAYAFVHLEEDRHLIHLHSFMDHYPRRLPDKSWIEGPEELD